MALPGNVLVSPFSPASFDEPDDITRLPRTTDFELGGTALNNPSQGLQVQNWKFSYSGGNVVVAPDPYAVETVLFAQANVTEVSGSFTQNMGATVVFVANGQATLWFFDTNLGAMTFVNLPVGARTPMLALDDKRASASSYSDILLFYLLNNDLVYTQQRDRFTIPRVLHTFSGPLVSILRCGMNKGLRLQIEVEGANAV